MFLSTLFATIGDFCFFDLWRFFYNAGRTCAYIPFVGDDLEHMFQNAADICDNLGRWFYRISNEVQLWWDGICELGSDINTLKNYVTDTVRGWFREAKELALDAVNSITTLRDNLFKVIDSQIDDWWQSIKHTIRDWIDIAETTVAGRIDIAKTTVAGWIDIAKTTVAGWIDIAKQEILSTIAAPINLISTYFDDIQDFFSDPLDWLESKFTDWFLGKEQ